MPRSGIESKTYTD